MLKYEDYYIAQVARWALLKVSPKPRRAPKGAVYVCFAQSGADRSATMNTVWASNFPEQWEGETYRAEVFPAGEVSIPVIRFQLNSAAHVAIKGVDIIDWSEISMLNGLLYLKG